MYKEGLQLLPGTKKRLNLKVPGENKFLYIGSAILGVVIVASFALGRYEVALRAQVENLNDQLTALEQKRSKSEEEDLRVLKDRLLLTSQLLDEHIYWTKALSAIEGLIQGEVEFESLSGSVGEGVVNIKARAGNYTVLARQIASFLTGPGIKDVSLGQIQPLSNGKIEFEIQLKFNKTKFVQNK